jgi:hypothetical protein
MDPTLADCVANLLLAPGCEATVAQLDACLAEFPPPPSFSSCPNGVVGPSCTTFRSHPNCESTVVMQMESIPPMPMMPPGYTCGVKVAP